MHFFDKRKELLMKLPQKNDETSCNQAFERDRKKKPKSVKFGNFCIILAIIMFVIAKVVGFVG